MTTTKAPEALLQKIRQGNRFVLTSHVSPDGDSVASALGLARILRSQGKGALIWSRDSTPSVYSPLPGADRIHSGAEPPAGFPEKFDAAIVLECPTIDRTGLAEHLAVLPILNIDHHLGNQHYGEANWVDTAAPAVGEMIFRLAQGLHLNLDSETATALYLTLVTDTGGFRFANSTPAAFEAAAALVRSGARPELVAQWIYESQPEASVRLLGAMLGTLELHHGGKVATVVLTPSMFQESGAAPGDSEGLIDTPRSIAGVEAVGLVKDLGNGHCKVSLRSRGAVDVQKIALQFGGGGHQNAAGCTIEGADEAVRARIVAALTETVG